MMNSGYARKQERQSDLAAVTILKRVGYDPNALARVLKNMESKLKPGGHDFAATHPPPAERIKDVTAAAAGATPKPALPARATRFQGSMSGV
jgi:predicted Zn-dependent protease